VENAPETIDGAAAWELVISSPGQVRVAGMGGIIGLEVGALVDLSVHQGNDPAIMSRLIPSIERGLLMAVSDKGSDDGI
tara:strand:- start:3650 stop:3886 length:237 start_codon:yes stop_codon:yes gene_type:complete